MKKSLIVIYSSKTLNPENQSIYKDFYQEINPNNETYFKVLDFLVIIIIIDWKNYK